MPITVFTSNTKYQDFIKTSEPPSFRFAYCEYNGFDYAYNWKVFSSEVVDAIWKKKNSSEPPLRPHFIIKGYSRIPSKPVALLIGNPVTKFIAACHEDGIEPEDALKQVSDGKFPSFHFFPQSRFLGFGGQPIYLWKAPDHIEHFWDTLDLVEPPKIYEKQIDFQYEAKLREIYKEDFNLYESIKEPQTLAESKSEVNPTLWEQMRNVGFAVGKFSASGFKPTTKEVLEERESICHSCDQWDAAALKNTGRCKKCGCSTWAKLRMATERCPLGKWEAVSVEDSAK
jgi:predicted Zn-ribbon and HTH transcriptional regulator